MMDVLITAPTVEPILAATAKLHLRVDHSTDDDLIAALITAAREMCEQHTRRAFITQARELSLDRWPAGTRLAFPVLPLLAVTSIKYTDEDGVEATMSSSDYVVDTVYGVLVLKSGVSWPSVTLRETAAIKVRYSAGYGAAGSAVPAPIKQAMLLLIGEWYEQREAGVVRDTSAAAALLSPYRNWVVSA